MVQGACNQERHLNLHRCRTSCREIIAFVFGARMQHSITSWQLGPSGTSSVESERRPASGRLSALSRSRCESRLPL